MPLNAYVIKNHLPFAVVLRRGLDILFEPPLLRGMIHVVWARVRGDTHVGCGRAVAAHGGQTELAHSGDVRAPCKF